MTGRKDGDLLVQTLRAKAYFTSIGLPEWEFNRSEIALYLWLERN